jgi:hypothetical protein
MDKNEVIAQNMVALSRRRGKKKKGNPRSTMLRMVMPMLSQENGEKLAKAIQDKDVNKLRNVWDKIKSQLTDKLADKAEASNLPEGVEGITTAEIYDQLVDEIGKTLNSEVDADESLSANQDLSRLLTGNARIPKLTRELAANGRIEIENKNGEMFIVIINDIVVPSNPNVSKNPKMKVEAEIYKENEKARMYKVEHKGELGGAISEIVVDAMALIEAEI